MKNITMLLAFLVSNVCALSAQESTTITGLVVDRCGQPVPYASIFRKKSTGDGDASDINGRFRIKKVWPSDTLICSHINFIAKQQPVNGNTTVIVTLESAPTPLTQTFVSTFSIYKSVTPVTALGFLQKDTTSNTEDYEKTFTKVELPARFEHRYELQGYLERIISFPEKSSYVPFLGTVVARFRIDKFGQVNDIRILRNVNADADTALINAVKATKGFWEPAQQNGRTVDSYQDVSIYLNVEVQFVKRDPILPTF